MPLILRETNMKVLVHGTFDHLHPGHEYLLREAGTRGELWVVVARDTTVETIKGHRPDQTESERKQAIEAAFPHAHVVLGHDSDYLTPLRAIEPDLVILGYDQHLPPGVEESDFPCAVERLDAFHPKQFKSSLRGGDM